MQTRAGTPAISSVRQVGKAVTALGHPRLQDWGREGRKWVLGKTLHAVAGTPPRPPNEQARTWVPEFGSRSARGSAEQRLLPSPSPTCSEGQ